MGMFKSVRDLQKQSKEINKNWDAGAQIEDSKQRMADATQMMADQTAAANLAATGTEGTATVAAVRDGGGMVNFQPMMEIDLTVIADGRPPMPVTVKQVVPQAQLAMMQPGKNIKIKFDPENPTMVWIDPTSLA